MTTAAKRLNKKVNRANTGRHTGFEHVKAKRCLICRPLPRKQDDNNDSLDSLPSAANP
jgi:hypothetical protein